MNNLSQRKVLLIICGGISAYKSLELIRLLKKRDVEVKTILTKSAKEFVTTLSVASLSQGKVYDDLFNAENESEMIAFRNQSIVGLLLLVIFGLLVF